MGEHRVSSKRAKLLTIKAKYSNNKGLYIWPLTVLFVKKNLSISLVQSTDPLLFKNSKNDNLGSIPQ